MNFNQMFTNNYISEKDSNKGQRLKHVLRVIKLLLFELQCLSNDYTLKTVQATSNLVNPVCCLHIDQLV